MIFAQQELSLPPLARGFHLVTRAVTDACPELSSIQVGLFHLFIKHTSASLTINENADPDVRTDMETAICRVVPENQPFVHTMEGPDDMPAHVKSSLFGSSVSIPIADGALNLGMWQGIYLCEHRDRGGSRKLVATLIGQSTPTS